MYPEAHTDCNIGFQSVGADKRADDKSRDWQERVKLVNLHKLESQ